MKRLKDNLVGKQVQGKIIRFVIFLLVLAISLCAMLALDSDNSYRPAFLENEIVTDILAEFGLDNINIAAGPWVLFGVLMFVIAVMVFADLAELFFKKRCKKFVERLGETEEVQTKRWKRTYYVTACVIALVLGILICIVAGSMGVFENPDALQGYDPNDPRYEDEIPPDIWSMQNFVDMLKNFAIVLLIFTCTIIIVPLIIIAVLLLIYGVLYLCTMIFQTIKRVGGASQDALNKMAEDEGDDEDAEGETTADAQEDETTGTTETTADGAGGFGGGLGFGTGASDLPEVKDLFPSLYKIDVAHAEEVYEAYPRLEVTLEELAPRFQSYLAKQKLYFDMRTLRNFLAGMVASRLLILEGLSGTGKSTLPRLFSEFVGSKAFFCPVQATWRDRTDVVGYYSDFTHQFKETDFLRRMYEASYEPDRLNMMVLDEMNISRIEYYFADFLSILEYPPQDWLVKLMQIREGQEQPVKMEDGNARIPLNTWFIGTANTDDSTFTITDKVYDRAIVLEFNQINEPISPDYDSSPLHGLSVPQLLEMFEGAKQNESYRLTGSDRTNFLRLCQFVQERLDVRFGNRIMNQIDNFVPVFVALGGTKSEALDFMFSRKVMRKLQGKYDDYIKDGLNELIKFLNTQYGKGVFSMTETAVATLQKKLL